MMILPVNLKNGGCPEFIRWPIEHFDVLEGDLSAGHGADGDAAAVEHGSVVVGAAVLHVQDQISVHGALEAISLLEELETVPLIQGIEVRRPG